MGREGSMAGLGSKWCYIVQRSTINDQRENIFQRPTINGKNINRI
jgi:hypothetical protein